MKVVSHLISGAGNTFHIISEDSDSESAKLTSAWSQSQKKQFTQKACNLNAADGLIFLKNGLTVTWDFYNNDGSDAEMCGNATRCVGLYLSQICQDKSTLWNLKTTAGLIRIEKVNPELFKVVMTAIQIFNSELGFYCDTGVPHLVQQLKDLNTFAEHKEEARILRNHSEFQPRGTNVTYVELLQDEHKVKAVSYERGVEDFTKACGTGAMAAAAYNLMKRGSVETQVEMPGGTLMMNLADLKQPIMIGPAKLVGKYEYEESV